jgi:hypothetical protein
MLFYPPYTNTGGRKGKSFLPPWMMASVFSTVFSLVARFSGVVGYFFPKVPQFMARFPRILGYGSNYTNLVCLLIGIRN